MIMQMKSIYFINYRLSLERAPLVDVSTSVQNSDSTERLLDAKHRKWFKATALRELSIMGNDLLCTSSRIKGLTYITSLTS